MARPSSREQILDAYEGLLVEHGAGDASLNAIAERAGVSKGGLLYHFPSKDHLVEAFGERLLDRVGAMVAQAPAAPADLIRWFLLADYDDPAEVAFWNALIAAVHGADDGLRRAIELAFEGFARSLDVLGAATAVLVRLVGDGLVLNATIGITVLSPLELDRLVADLVEFHATHAPV